MRNKTSILLLASMAALMNPSEIPMYLPEDEKEKETEEEAQSRLNKARGLHLFMYGTHKVWAINQKTADKKAKRLNYV